MSGHRGELQPSECRVAVDAHSPPLGPANPNRTGRHRQQRWRSPPASQPAVMAISNFYPGWESTALHTDICSPVATNPTWSKLPKADQETLEMYGLPLWHDLLDQLRPHIVVISVADIIWRTSCSTHTAGGRSCTPSTGRRRHTALTPVPGPVPLVRCRRRPVPLRLLPGREDAPHYQRQPEARWAPSPARHGRAARSRLLLRSGNIP